MLSEELIAKIADSLDAMPPKPASRRELDLLLTGIEAKIRAAQERGATYAEIAMQISQSGYPIKCSTLRVALQRRRPKAATKRPRQRNVAKDEALETPASGVRPAADTKATPSQRSQNAPREAPPPP